MGEEPWLDIANSPTELCLLNISHLVLELSYLDSLFELVPNIFTFLHFLPILLLHCIKFNGRELWHSRSAMDSLKHGLFELKIYSWISTQM